MGHRSIKIIHRRQGKGHIIDSVATIKSALRRRNGYEYIFFFPLAHFFKDANNFKRNARDIDKLPDGRFDVAKNIFLYFVPDDGHFSIGNFILVINKPSLGHLGIINKLKVGPYTLDAINQGFLSVVHAHAPNKYPSRAVLNIIVEHGTGLIVIFVDQLNAPSGIESFVFL